MNWKRIMIYIGILFLSTILASLPFGVANGFFQAQGKAIPIWVKIGPAISVPCATLIVFLFLSRSQEENPWGHAVIVAILSWLISFPINVIGLGQPITTWVGTLIVISIALVTGTFLGMYVRKFNN